MNPIILTRTDVIQREILPGVEQIHYIDKYSGSGGISMGEVVLAPGTEIKGHYHKVEDVMIVLDGRGSFILDGTEHPIEAGMGIIAPAGRVHGLKNNSEANLRIVYAWPSVDVERFFVDNPE